MPECGRRLNVRRVRVADNGSVLYSLCPEDSSVSSGIDQEHVDDALDFEDEVNLWNAFLSNRMED